MADLVLSDLENLENQISAVATINANNAAIEAAVSDAITKTGPNVMSSNIDMNSKRITNLPAAASPTEPIRKAEFDAFPVAAAVTAAASAATSASQSASSASSASSSASSAASSASAANTSATSAAASATAAQTAAGVGNPGAGNIGRFLKATASNAFGWIALAWSDMPNVSAGRVLGRRTGTAGSVEELPIAVDANNNFGFGVTTNLTSRLNIGGAGTASFTGSTPGAMTLLDTSGVANNFTNLDFTTAGNVLPVARVGMQFTPAGSFLNFGVSNSYVTGITLNALTIAPWGGVAFSGSYGTAGQVLTSAGPLAPPTWGSVVTSISAGGGLTGGTITGTGTIQVDTSTRAIGQSILAAVNGTVPDGATVAGSQLTTVKFFVSAEGTQTGGALTGTWRNISGQTLFASGFQDIGNFVRTA